MAFMLLTTGIYFLKPANKTHTIANPAPASLTERITQPTPQISIEKLFTYNNPDKSSKSDPDEYTLIATGDVIPARSVNTRIVNMNNFSYPFEKTAGFLKSADAVFINLESPLIQNCPMTDEGMIFCGDAKNIQGLIFAGVTVASIANNHAGNHGINGINSTISLLVQNQISVTGNDQPTVITIKDKRFGFLGYNDIGHKEPGISWAGSDRIKQDIKALRARVDFLIVTFHWGVEYTSTPNPRQKELAHLAIDSGADLIIGNHPHWVQGVEEYKGKFITYAHGNFVFDQGWSQKTKEGVLGRYTFNRKGLKDIKFYPVIIEGFSQPRFAKEAEAKKILDDMKKSTLSIAEK